MRFFKKKKTVYLGPTFSPTESHNLPDHDHITCKFCSSRKMTEAWGFVNNHKQWRSYCLECGLVTILTNNKRLNQYSS